MGVVPHLSPLQAYYGLVPNTEYLDPGFNLTHQQGGCHNNFTLIFTDS